MIARPPLLSLLTLVVLCACSSPPPPTASAAPPETADVPHIVIGENLPTDPVDMDTSAPGDDVVTVGSVERLLGAIRSNRTIRLRAGTYDLGAVTHENQGPLRWEKVHDGEELVIDGVESLTIEAAADERPQILARPRYAFVLALHNAKNVTLKNLVLGHTPEGSCTGGVVSAVKSENIAIEGSDLFGSGTIGVSLRDVTHFQFSKSAVRECTYGIAEIHGSTDVVFSEAAFVDNEQYDLVDVKSSPSVRFERCTFSKNRTDKGFGHVFFKVDDTSSVVLSEVSFQNNTFDQLTNDKARLTVVGGSGVTGWASQQLNKPDPQYNQIYALARYRHWMVAGTQAGIVFWNTKTGSVDKLHKAFISNHLKVRGKYLWAGTYNNVLRFDGLTAKSYLPSAVSRGGQLVTGHKGELFVKLDGLSSKQSPWWRYDDQGDRFRPAAGASAGQAPTALGGFQSAGFYDVVTRANGEVWAIHFLRSIVRHKAGKTTVMPLKSAVYPGHDPRRFYVAPNGALWAVDFDSGFLRFDDKAGSFVRDPTVQAKGSDMAIDAKNKRTWLLHYTQGLHLVRPNTASHFFDLHRLQYMRALHLDADGSVWVGGWNALVHITRQGASGWRERSYEVSTSTLAPGVTP